jgi:hypothetical protein
MLKNWSRQAQDHEFFLFVRGIMTFFFRLQLLSPTGARWRVDACTLNFRRVRYTGSPQRRTPLQKPSLPAKTNLPYKDRTSVRGPLSRSQKTARDPVMALPAVL